MRLSLVIRLSALVLIPALLSNSWAFAASNPVDTQALMAKLTALGVGARIRVTLADKTEAKGVLTGIGEKSFAVESKNAAQPREIEYAQLTGVHKGGLSTAAKVGIGVLIGVTLVAVVLAVLIKTHPLQIKTT